MNKVTRNSELTLPKVTTGPLPASTKVYSAPEGFPDLAVPLREIALSEKAGEAPGPRLRQLRPLHRRERQHRRDARSAAPARSLGR